MAISKTQPMRSAEIELVDAVNDTSTAITSLFETTADIAEDVTTLDRSLAQEIETRSTADGLINASLSNISATLSQITESDLPIIDEFIGNFRMGFTEDVTIAASATETGSVTFNPSFTSQDHIIVFVCPIGTSESFAKLTSIVTAVTHTGFSWSIANTDSVSHTVSVGYMAIKAGSQII